jgi:hypothetical protein
MGRKVSDEWVVPLCATHHRALHGVGNEEKWWKGRGIPSRTALNIAAAGNPNYCLLTNRGPSGECRLNRWNDSMATTLEGPAEETAARNIGRHGWQKGKHG